MIGHQGLICLMYGRLPYNQVDINLLSELMSLCHAY